MRGQDRQQSYEGEVLSWQRQDRIHEGQGTASAIEARQLAPAWRGIGALSGCESRIVHLSAGSMDQKLGIDSSKLGNRYPNK